MICGSIAEAERGGRDCSRKRWLCGCPGAGRWLFGDFLALFFPFWGLLREVTPLGFRRGAMQEMASDVVGFIGSWGRGLKRSVMRQKAWNRLIHQRFTLVFWRWGCFGDGCALCEFHVGLNAMLGCAATLSAQVQGARCVRNCHLEGGRLRLAGRADIGRGVFNFGWKEARLRN